MVRRVRWWGAVTAAVAALGLMAGGPAVAQDASTVPEAVPPIGFVSIGPYGTAATVVVDPSDPGVLFASTGQGLFVSTDEATTWRETTPPGADGILAIAPSPGSDERAAGAVAVTGDALYHGTAAGWTTVGAPPESGVVALLADPLDPLVLFAATASDLWFSTDGGATWTPGGEGLPRSEIDTLAANRRALFAGTRQGLFTTADPREGWTLVEGLTAGRVYQVVPDQVDQDDVLAHMEDGVFQSSDGGATWTPIGQGLEQAGTYGLVRDPATPQTVLAATSSGLFVRPAGAGAFAPSSGTRDDVGTYGLTAVPGPDPLVLASSSSGLIATADAGATWRVAATGLAGGNARSVSVDPRDPLGLLAMVDDGLGAIWASADGGRTWTQGDNGALPFSGIFSVVHDPATAGRVLAATRDGIFSSTDDGATWAALGDPFEGSGAIALAAAPAGDGRWVAATADERIWLSADGGATWAEGPDATAIGLVAQLGIDPSDSGTIYAATQNGLFVSRAGGTWEPTGTVPSERQVDALALDPATPGLLRIATIDGIFRSADGGATFSPEATPGLEGLDIDTLAVDPSEPARLYVGTSAAVLRQGPEPALPASADAPGDEDSEEGAGGALIGIGLLLAIGAGGAVSFLVLRRRRGQG